MEAVMIRKPSNNAKHPKQAGFSLVELLMASFILAIGILGLTMLQLMAMRSNAGSRSMTTAVMIGEGVLESIQAEGRQRMLFHQVGGVAPATTYFGGGSMTQWYTFDGTSLPSATGAYYTVNITPQDVVPISGSGGTKNFLLVISFADVVDPTNPTVTIPRTVTLSRQVLYAA
jgi:prepilin-type N-terminal cleavage/methylation domain-containing protein